MNDLLRITIFAMALVFATGNVYLMVRRKLSERTTILWLFGTVVSLLVAAFPSGLNAAARAVGVSYPPALLYLAAILVLLSIVMYQSTQISTLDHKLREIGQTVALLRFQTDQIVSAPVTREVAVTSEGVSRDDDK